VITLVLGGVRSGKSEVAERLAGPGPGTYLATGMVAPGDDDFARRVARHQARRPASWATVEEPGAVPDVLARLEGVVLLDALGTWIANDLEANVDALVKALVHRRGDTIVVSEEVGLGVHPVTEVGRLFADRLGEANRRVAEVADRCLLVVAGRILDLSAGRHATDPDPDSVGPIGRGGFRQALAFLTPLGGAASPTRAAFVWFPIVGALLGLLLGSIWWATEAALGPFAAAAVVVAADLALTGAIHFDGLIDSADGLLPHLPPERRLTVMAEPHIGAFAIATGVSALLLRTAALTALGTARPLLLAAVWCVARTAMTVTALTGRYARTHGLASSFLSEPNLKWLPPAAIGTVLAVGLAVLDGPGSVIAIAAAGAGAAGVGALARRRIGGFTGDTLGAGGVIAETVGLLSAAAVLRP
jgi:cobalamin 5'-phosphate synthase/cobalamin synthase